jgi:HAD superfamily hydrolase (TIGR01509 family)
MIKLIIFDFDGVIMDSERLHFEKFRDVLLEWGEPFSWEDYCGKYLALSDRDCFEAVLLDRGWKAGKDGGAEMGPKVLTRGALGSMCARKEELFNRDAITGLKPVPGTIEFIRRAAAHHAMAIASGSLHSEILDAIRGYDLERLFDTIVGADDVSRGKPDPEPFLKAMELAGKKRNLEYIPADCAVIEDSIVGIEAAHLAGMKCIALTTSFPREKLERADLVTGTLEKLVLPMVLDGV